MFASRRRYRLRQMLVDHQSEPEALRATGTDNHAADSPKVAQRAERETRRSAAKGKVKAPHKKNAQAFASCGLWR